MISFSDIVSFIRGELDFLDFTPDLSEHGDDFHRGDHLFQAGPLQGRVRVVLAGQKPATEDQPAELARAS